MSKHFRALQSKWESKLQSPHPLEPQLVSAEQSDSTASEFVNAVYYPCWRVFRKQTPSSMNLKLISHVFYAFSRVRTDGTIYLLDEYADTKIAVDGTNGCLHAFALLKQQHPHLKVILSLGGGSGSAPFPALAADPAARDNLGRCARELVNTYSLDGIDVDWEHPSTPAQGDDYVCLLASIRSHLPKPRFLLTTALPAGEWCLRNIDLPRAMRYLDLINMMGYDFSGHWTELSGHQSQLYAPLNAHNAFAKRSCHGAISYLLSRNVPPSKILLGIPAYGRSFLGVDGIGQPFTGHAGEQGIFEYKDLPRPGTEENVDEELGAAWCKGGDGGWVSYDNPRTVSMKASYVREKKLAGVFFWTGVSDSRDSRSLVETAYSCLHA